MQSDRTFTRQIKNRKKLTTLDVILNPNHSCDITQIFEELNNFRAARKYKLW